MTGKSSASETPNRRGSPPKTQPTTPAELTPAGVAQQSMPKGRQGTPLVGEFVVQPSNDVSKLAYITRTENGIFYGYKWLKFTEGNNTANYFSTEVTVSLGTSGNKVFTAEEFAIKYPFLMKPLQYRKDHSNENILKTLTDEVTKRNVEAQRKAFETFISKPEYQTEVAEAAKLYPQLRDIAIEHLDTVYTVANEALAPALKKRDKALDDLEDKIQEVHTRYNTTKKERDDAKTTADAATTDFPEIHEDFDFEDTMEFYDLDSGSWYGYWYTPPDGCPIAGYTHTHAKRTGFFWDGKNFGWHDFAQGCIGSEMSIGKVIVYLNMKKGEPYKKPIWEQVRKIELFDSDELPIDFADPVAEPPRETIGSEAELWVAVEAAAPPKTEVVKPAQSPLISEYEYVADIEAPKPTVEAPINPRVFEVDPDYALAFPPEAAYGWLGKKASQLDSPMGWAYPTMLAVFAGQGINLLKTDIEVRSNLYVCLVANKGEGKSRTFNRALTSLPYANPERIKKGVPGSEHGLVNLFVPPRPKKPPKGSEVEEPIPELFSGLLVQDEFKATLNKVAIQGSCLPTTLCQAFYDDEITASAVKQGVRSMLCRLSIVGGLKAADPEEFAQVFGSNTNDGLYDRFIFGVAKEGWEFDDEWKPNPEMRFPKGVTIPSSCFKLVKEWRAEGKACDPPKNRGRMGELALRVALVSASANHESTVSDGCMRAALRFMEWQELIRATYEAGVAENQDAVITSAVMNKLKSYGKNPDDSASVAEEDKGRYKWVKWWPMYRRTNWRKRWGSTKMKYIKAAMIEEGTIEEEMKVVEDGDGNKNLKLSGRVRFHG